MNFLVVESRDVNRIADFAVVGLLRIGIGVFFNLLFDFLETLQERHFTGLGNFNVHLAPKIAAVTKRIFFKILFRHRVSLFSGDR